jgi:GNAT superfamily N-acetyltransferase
MALRFPTDAERPDLRGSPLLEDVWPEFMYHDPVLNRFFVRDIRESPEVQFYAWDDERDEVVGQGNAVPFTWDGDEATLPEQGIDAALESRFTEDGPPAPNVLCALQIMVAPSRRGEGLSRRMIQRMGELGRGHGLDTLIAPVRPSLKDRYPLTPIERYVEWRRPDGAHLDPWVRTHERLGAEIVKVAPRSMTIPAPVADWEEWTSMQFPDTGSYVVPGALVPVQIDRERDEGLYVEPNVWMVHRST